MWSYTSTDNQWKDINVCQKDKWNVFLGQYEVCDIEISTSNFSIIIDNKITRKNMTSIRIGTKSSSLYKKPTTQYNNQVLPPLINMRLLSNDFFNSISTDVLESINWSENERVSIPASCKHIPSNFSKSTSTSTSTFTSHDNPPILPSLYPIFDKLYTNNSKLDDKHLDVISLKNLLSEVSCVLTDNNTSLNLEKWSGRGNKELIQISSIGHLKYDRFNIKSFIL